ncbi:MAG: DUF433 domain-containing protein [Isosphaeraceae bacterium]|nr:DUF433 domain-containing protein [Isosphaeraceae bacterium]
MASVSTEHIEITPGVCGGRPRIAGHRITVQNVVVWHEQMGMSPDEIVATHPTITLADVHAAMAYYHDHQEEIRARMKADDAFVAEMQANAPPSRYQQLLAERHAQHDTVPPR